MKRRRFLKLAAVGTAAVALPAAGLSSGAFFRKAVAGIIHRDLDYLKHDDETVDKFARDFLGFINNELPMRESFMVRSRVVRRYVSGAKPKSIGALEDFVPRYLLSTDFFQNKMDESRILQYTGFYHQSKKSCGNPFSHLFYPRSTTA
ncbi:MAG TPA: twin-arginine translocation signal domain-containing protein [Chitinophagaceae bacterium]|jgi:hypothetical protein|nr:twin-arginine translocation signal domain-containing protein [Chitinophagaceae bacterium]